MATRDIWIASSPDLVSWGQHRQFTKGFVKIVGIVGVGRRASSYYKTDEGWLIIYHGAKLP